MSHQIIYQALLTLHLVGLILGMGGATVTDYSFFRNLKQGDRISPETVTWMRSFSQVVWAGIGILAVSGLGLFLLDPSKYLHSAGFMAKMLFVLILVVNGLFLNFYTTARLTTFNFSEKYRRRDAAWRARKLSFIFGTISVTTWYATLIVAMFKSFMHAPFVVFVGVYIVVLAVAILAGLLLERLLYSRIMPRTPSADPRNMSVSSLATFPSDAYKAHIADALPKPQHATSGVAVADDTPETQEADTTFHSPDSQV